MLSYRVFERQILDSSSNLSYSLLCVDGVEIQSWVHCLQAAQLSILEFLLLLFCSMFGLSILYNFQSMYHPNMVKTSQIKKDHSNYPSGPPLQHRTKDLAQAMKGQIATPHQQAHLGIAASWLKLRLHTRHFSSLML